MAEGKLDTLMKEMTALKKMVADLKEGGGGGNGSGKQKKKKDPNAPKRPLNEFFIFQKDARPKVKAALEKKGEKVTNKEVNAELKAQWDKIKTTNEKLYKKFQDAAVKDKARYVKEMEEYRKNKPADAEDDASDADDDDAAAGGGGDDAADADASGDEAEPEEKPKTKPKAKAPAKSKSAEKAASAEKAPAKSKSGEKAAPAAKASKSAEKAAPAAKASKSAEKAAPAAKAPEKSKGKSSKKKGGDDEEGGGSFGSDSDLSDVASLDSAAFSDDDLLDDL